MFVWKGSGVSQFRLFVFVALLVASPACAQGPDLPDGPPGGKPPSDAQSAAEDRLIAPSARLLAEARRLRESEGCAAAAPTYRVVSGMGAGEEAAQHELGECLLTVTGASAVETELFRQEAVFWLTRAAYAGNARAQRALAMHFAPQSMGAGANAEALKWALVYARNPDAKLYGYKELPQTFVPGLTAALTPDSVARAQTFAASFQPLTLAKFEPPKLKKGKGPFGETPGGAPPRGKPRAGSGAGGQAGSSAGG